MMERRLTIGIDARFLTHPQSGGFKTYTVNLIDALSKVDSRNRYIVYTDRSPAEGLAAPLPDNFRRTVVSASVPVVGMPLREQHGLRSQLHRDQPDLVHFLCNTSTWRPPVPYVATLHDTIQLTRLSWPVYSSSLAESCKRQAIHSYSRMAIIHGTRRADCIITVSNFERRLIEQRLGAPPDRLAVTHLAANALFQPPGPEVREAWRREVRDRLGVRSRFVLGVGYEKRKNMRLLIDAFVRVASTDQDLSLVIVAAEEGRRRNLQDYASRAGVRDRTAVVGPTSAVELAKLYCTASVFAFPSERESFGLPPLEAMSCGTPTIALAASSVPEITRGGALLLESVEPEAWAAGIKRILSDDGLTRELQALGIERGRSFSWRKCAEATLDVYEKVAETVRHRCG